MSERRVRRWWWWVVAASWSMTLAADPPRSIAVDPTAPPSAWLPQVLPEGSRVLHGPVAMAFGAHASGHLLSWRTAEGGYAVAYLTPEAGETGRQRWLWLREPRATDDAFDVEVHASLSVGPPLSRDIVMLETSSRAAPAGGIRVSTGRVYRRVGDGVEHLPALAERLHGVTRADQARVLLAPAYDALLPIVPGRLAALFASLPWPLVELTALERLQRLLPEHPDYGAYDPAQGYLEIRGDAGLPGYQAALFRHAGGGWLLALQTRWPGRQRTWFLHPVAAAPGGWQDLSADLMPEYRADREYRLPRRGRVVRAEGAAAWQWTGQRFEPSPAAR
jgi:hypothetical protein